MGTLSYAGIGARRTPERVRRDMTTMAAWLARKGWRLRSGGARGGPTKRSRRGLRRR